MGIFFFMLISLDSDLWQQYDEKPGRCQRPHGHLRTPPALTSAHATMGPHVIPAQMGTQWRSLQRQDPPSPCAMACASIPGQPWTIGLAGARSLSLMLLSKLKTS